MANELVLGLGMDPRTVAAMKAEEVRYWFSTAVKRKQAIKQEAEQGS